METCIANCKTCKLPGVAVAIPAALNSSLNESMLKELLIEELGVATKVTDQVTDFGPNASVFMLDQHIQVVVNVRVMDCLIEVL